MSISSIKKALLAGTALVAVTAFSVQAHAAGATLSADTTWASAGTHTSSPADGTAAAAGDSVNTNGHVLAITNNGTANDGSGLNTFSVGAISGTTANDGVAVVNGSANDISVTIASINETGAGNEGVAFLNALQGSGEATNSIAATVTGNFVTGGPVAISNTDTASAKAVNVTVNGAMTVTGAAIAIGAGTHAGADAILTLKGAGLNTLAPVTLVDSDGTGDAELVIAGSAAQTVAGTINGGAAGEGTLIVSNTNGGVTFSNAIGGNASLREIDAGVTGTTTTFNAAVNATTLNVTGTGTVALGAQTFTGNIAFGGNDGTVTLSSGTITGNIDTTTANTGTVTVTDAGTITGTIGSATTGHTLRAVNAGTAGTATITGDIHATTLNVTGTGTVALGGTLTGALAYGANNGTVTLATGKNITGAVTSTNTGMLTLSGTNTVSGAIGNLSILNAGQNGGTATLSGTVNANAINIGNGTTNFAGAVTGAIDLGGNNGTVALASGATLTGSVDSTGSSSGTLTLQGGAGVSGTVGATNALTLVNAAQSTGTSTFGGLVKATTLGVGAGTAVLNGGFTGTTATFSSNGTLQLGAGQTLTGDVATTTAGTGKFEFLGNGTVTGTMGAGPALNMLTVSGTGATATVNGDIAAANTTTVGGNTLATNGTFTMGASQTLSATITGAATNGQVAATGILTIPHGATLNVMVDPSYHPAAGAFGGTYDIATGAGGGSVDSAVTITSSPLYTFTQVANTDNLQVTGVRNTIASVSTSANTGSVGAALDTIALTGDAALDDIQTDLNAVTTSAALNNVLSSLTPTVDGGAQTSILAVGAAVQDIADTRMDSLRNSDGSTGYASGYFANGSSIWAQGYGQTATQDMRDTVAGYDATTAGVAVGADTADLFDEGIIGLMFNYGHSKIDSNNANTTKTTVANYGVNLYGTAFLLEQMFLEWQAGYSYNKIASVRHDVGAAGIDANGETGGRAYDARLQLGKDYTVGYGTILTPTASLSYARLNTDGYTETGSGANLNVGSSTQNALDVGVGAKMTWNLRSYYGPLMKPMVRVSYSYAALDDRVETTSTFAGANPATNPSFVTQGPSPERSRFDFGAGLSYWTMENWDLTANANYEYRPDYHAYSGVLRATAHF